MKNLKKIEFNGPVVALGAANTFSYIIPSFYLKNYQIMCIRDRKDTRLMKEKVNIFCLEDYKPNVFVPKVNSKEMMKFPESKEFLFSFEKPALFVRKTTLSTQIIVDSKKFPLVTNSKDIRDPYEDKLTFRNSLIKAKVNPIDGFVVKYEDFSFEKIKKAQEMYGKKVVVQAAELTHGGGVGTGFIEDKNNYINYKERMDRIKNVSGRRIDNFIITRFVEGTPSSVLGCVTRYGIIVGPIQTQIQDISDVVNLKKGDGVYCGHDWDYKKNSKKVVKKVEEIVKRFGEEISKNGYKGIFGLDLIINHKTDEVCPIECNPRYTDALPVISLFSMEKNIPTLEYFHLLEHLNVDYELEIRKINKKYKRRIVGSQILLMSKSEEWIRNNGEIEAGIYEFKNKKIKFIKPSFETKDIRNKNQFLVTDGVPFKGTEFKPRSRILRLIFKTSILEEDKKLKENISFLIDIIYKKLDFIEIKK